MTKAVIKEVIGATADEALAMHHSWSAIVPLRAGSKGLPGKNVRPLAGLPLYRYAINAAQAAGAQTCWISTDITQVLEHDHGSGVKSLARPSHLQGDTVEMALVLLDLIERAGINGTVVLLQATSPLRKAVHIKTALDLFATQKHDLVMSVTAAERGVLKWGLLSEGVFKPIADPKYCFSNRQQLPAVVRPNGAVYVFDAQWFVRNAGFVTDKIGAFEMNALDSQDIDTLEDFERCEQLIHAR
jgi:CMP-N-acetylneuraminic acid synthetase